MASYLLKDNDCLIRVFKSFVKNISYYAGIMLNTFSDLLYSELCWHNWLVTSYYKFVNGNTVA